MSNRIELVKEFLAAFSKVDRNEFVENLLAADFTFSAPPDPLLKREEFFERCWPYGSNLKKVEYIRTIEINNEVIITHEFVNPDGLRARNTDIFTFSEDKIVRFEVYFGWEIKDRSL